MSDTHISVGDTGVVIKACVYHPIYDAAAVKFLLKNPRRGLCEITAEVSDLQKGIIKYVSRTGDFDRAGEYTIQAQVIFNDGHQLTGSSHKFTVHNYFD